MGLTWLVSDRGALELVEPSVERCNFELANQTGRVDRHWVRLDSLSVHQGGAHCDRFLVDINCRLISFVSIREHCRITSLALAAIVSDRHRELLSCSVEHCCDVLRFLLVKELDALLGVAQEHVLCVENDLDTCLARVYARIHFEQTAVAVPQFDLLLVVGS